MKALTLNLYSIHSTSYFMFKQMSFKTIADLYTRFPWKSKSKFIPLAKRYGFKEKEAKEYLNKHIIHDQKVPKAEYMNIYSKHSNGFQMDTFINDKRKDGLNYLMLININTRKAYSYAMNGKGAKAVLQALQQFIKDEPNVYSITSDQDAAYLSNDVLDFMKSNDILYRTTEDNNHNVLGIINRFMRTIRDLVGENRFIDRDEMNELIYAYNNSPHSSLNYKAPNDITKQYEKEYIKKKSQNNPYNFQPEDRVRIVQAKEPLAKNRNRVSRNAYIVDSKAGNQFIVKSKDESIDKIPGYRLVVANPNVPIAKTLKGGKRGIVEKITSYDSKKNKYHIEYSEGTKDFIPAKNMREGAPTHLSRMELQYWSKKKNIPTSIKRWI